MLPSNLPRIDFRRGFSKASFVLCVVAFLTGSSVFAQDPVLSGSKLAAAETTSSGSTATPTPAKASTKKSAASATATHGTTTEPTLVVRAEELPSAYGAPPAFSRSRFSNLVAGYVLPPGGIYAGAIFQGDALPYNRPDFTNTQEFEFGLPYRFGVAIENQIESYRGTTQERSFSVEGRYAFADWDVIPLNPTIFAEYKFGIGHILHDEGPPEPLGKGEAQAFLDEQNPLPDAVEVRLLLSEQFFHRIDWALNGFVEQETSGDRGREYGFAQSALTDVLLPYGRLKVGVEMQLTGFTDAGIRGDPSWRYIIGPTIAWKPSRNTRFDVSGLFGATHDAPDASVFAVFSVLFGPGERESQEGEAPASMRNR